MVRVVIADDLHMFRQGIKTLLEMNPEIKVVGEAGDGGEVLDVVRKKKPDVLLLDINMPLKNGFEVAKELQEHHIHTHILMLSVHEEKTLVRKAFRNGAKGYVLKQSFFEEVLEAIDTVCRGERYMSSALLGEVTPEFLNEPDEENEINPLEVLSKRELEVLYLVARGNKNANIAFALNISEKTVEKHRANLIRKLGVRGVAGLVAIAIKYEHLILEE